MDGFLIVTASPFKWRLGAYPKKRCIRRSACPWQDMLAYSAPCGSASLISKVCS